MPPSENEKHLCQRDGGVFMRAQKPGARGNKAVVIIGVSLEIEVISDADHLSFGAGFPQISSNTSTPSQKEFWFPRSRGIRASRFQSD